MIVAFSSQGTTTDDSVEQRFGRCNNFIIIDTAKGTEKAISNSAAQAGGGAGIQAAELLVKEGVDTVVTGNVGPNAYRVLESANVKIYPNATKTIKEELAALLEGDRSAASGPTAKSHNGLGQ